MGMPQNGLLLHYTMANIQNGFLIDEKGNLNAAIYGATAAFTPWGGGLFFDGINDYVRIEDTGLIEQSSFTLHLSGVVAQTQIPKMLATRDNSVSGGRVFQFSILVSGELSFLYFSGSTITRADSLFTVNDGLPHTFGVTLEQGGDVGLYFDGQLIETVPAPLSINSNTSEPLLIGARRPSSLADFFSQYQREFSFYNRALSAAEMLELHEYALPKAIMIELNENIAATQFLIDAYRVFDGFSPGRRSADVSEFPYELTLPAEPYYVTISPDIGNIWLPESSAIVGQLCFPTNPSTTPYYFRCTIAGTTGATEPAWLTGSPGALTADGDAEWEMVERIPQPITHGPLIPQ